MNRVVRVGTRKSALAVAQAKLVADAMKAAAPKMDFQLVLMQTLGDRVLDRPLLDFGGKGVFVSEFEQGLLEGRLDFAVHSAKDLPMDLAEGLAIVGAPGREDPRDVVVTMAGAGLGVAGLAGAGLGGGPGKRGQVVVGTSSLRRQLQIGLLARKIWNLPVRCENVRGNVQTRLGKLEAGEYDAIILAAAGLNRLGLDQDPKYHFRYLDCDAFIPAGGQGILAIEGRIGDPVNGLAALVTHEETRLCLEMERRVLGLLGAGCHEPVGVYARIQDGRIFLAGISQKTGEARRVKLDGSLNQMEALACQAAEKLMERKT